MIQLIIDHLQTYCTDFAVIEPPTRINPIERKEYPVATVYLKSDQKIADNYSHNLYSRQWIILITADHLSLDKNISDIINALSGFRFNGIVTPFSYIEGKTESINGALLQFSVVIEATVCLGV